MKGLPIYFNIENKTIIVVGAGTAAAIKIKKLIDFEANIIVIAPKICKQICEYETQKLLKVKRKKFDKEDLFVNNIIISAADYETNQFVYKCAKEKGLICCVCSKNLEGDFIFPSHKKKGDIVVTAVTSGKYPLMSKKICEEINLDIADSLDFLKEKRDFVLKNIKDKTKKRKILNEFIEDENYKHPDKIENILKRYLNEQSN